MQQSRSFDARVRLGVYRFILRTGRVPAAAELASQLRRSEEEVLAAYRRLAKAHAIVLEPKGERILRAAPFWGSPTAFAVEVGRRSYWASCIWDALGVPAMLGRDARIRTWRHNPGAVFSLEKGRRLAKAWYADRLHPNWRPLTSEEVRALFRRLGFTGPFWRIPR